MSLNFPELDYEFWCQKWYDTIGKLRGYTCLAMGDYIQFNGSLLEIENEINSLVVQENLNDEKILYVVDLINRWGGKQSRLFYTRKDIESKLTYRQLLEYQIDSYKSAIKEAKMGNPRAEGMFRNVKGIGPSYSGKHAYFWSRANPKHTLIIIDQKIAGMLGYKTVQMLYQDFSYTDLVNAFANKSLEIFKEYAPHKIEKALFAYHSEHFDNNNNHLK